MPSAHDVVDGEVDSVAISCEDAVGNNVISSGQFVAGLTRVTCSATDEAGNQGNCQFNIIVEGIIAKCPIGLEYFTDDNYENIRSHRNGSVTLGQFCRFFHSNTL